MDYGRENLISRYRELTGSLRCPADDDDDDDGEIKNGKTDRPGDMVREY